MRIKNAKLKWNVMRHDFNSDKIIAYNIFHSNFPEELATIIKKEKISNREQLKERLRRWFMYYYWSKSEHEILVSGLHTRSEQEKIDVWYQIEMNFDHIVDYIIREMKLF